MKYFKIDGALIAAEHELLAKKKYRALFHKKAESVKEIDRPQ